MRREDFNDFYENTIKRHAQLFLENNKGYSFHESADRIYEEYLNQKTLMRLVLEKNNINFNSMKTSYTNYSFSNYS